jgi:hypothetical protein
MRDFLNEGKGRGLVSLVCMIRCDQITACLARHVWHSDFAFRGWVHNSERGLHNRLYCSPCYYSIA